MNSLEIDETWPPNPHGVYERSQTEEQMSDKPIAYCLTCEWTPPTKSPNHWDEPDQLRHYPIWHPDGVAQHKRQGHDVRVTRAIVDAALAVGEGR